MKHRDNQLIKKIISECKDIIRYTNALTRELWAEYQDIQWRKIVDLRNIVAHGYGELRMELVWNLSQREVPQLLKQMENMKKEEGE